MKIRYKYDFNKGKTLKERIIYAKKHGKCVECVKRRWAIERGMPVLQPKRDNRKGFH